MKFIMFGLLSFLFCLGCEGNQDDSIIWPERPNIGDIYLEMGEHDMLSSMPAYQCSYLDGLDVVYEWYWEDPAFDYCYKVGCGHLPSYSSNVVVWVIIEERGERSARPDYTLIDLGDLKEFVLLTMGQPNYRYVYSVSGEVYYRYAWWGDGAIGSPSNVFEGYWISIDCRSNLPLSGLPGVWSIQTHIDIERPSVPSTDEIFLGMDESLMLTRMSSEPSKTDIRDSSGERLSEYHWMKVDYDTGAGIYDVEVRGSDRLITYHD